MAAPTAEAQMSAQLPAPKTFAPSRDDVLSNLAFFFGDPAVPEKLRDYSEHHAMTYHFPDAYYGQNTKIRETLNNLILRSPQEWHTQVGLPFVKIEGTTVEWDELRFDVRLLQRVPYEGVSRMQTSLRRRHRDRVVRRGIGMTIESDFYATDAGRQHFRDQLTSIRYCVQETCNFDAIFAYLTCGNYDFRYDLSKGLRPRRAVRTAMAHEILMYAIVQKEGLGLDKAVEEVKYRMGRYQVTPNLLIVPPQLLLYLATAPEEKIKYSEGGDRAVTRFEEGAQGFETRAFRGMGVVTSMPYEVSDDQDSVQMLQRSSQVGEFYRMAPPPVPKATQDFGAGRTAMVPEYMDILIYDEEMDQLKHIPFAQAVRACALRDSDWRIICGKPADNTQDASFVKNTYGGTAWGALVGGSVTEKLITAVAEGQLVDICVVIARPFIEHLMMSCVATVSGRDTGATLFGPADMQISANTSVKTIEGHYTCHTKSVITKPQNVYVMRDIMCSGYVAGGNCRWFGSTALNNTIPAIGDDNAADAVAEAVIAGMNKRLSFEDDASGEYASMLAFGAPASDAASESRDQVISITDRLLPWEVARNAAPNKTYFPGGNAGYQVYKQKFALNQIHFGEDVRATENMAFMSQGAVNNNLCFLGPSRKYNPWAANFFELVPGQGHFGSDAIPGDARWRRGESVSLKTARDNMVSLEVAAHSQLVFGKPR